MEVHAQRKRPASLGGKSVSLGGKSASLDKSTSLDKSASLNGLSHKSISIQSRAFILEAGDQLLDVTVLPNKKNVSG